MKGERIAKRLAKALSDSLTIEALSPEIGKINTINSLIEKSREMKRFLSNPVFTFEEKSNIIGYLSEKTGLKEKTKNTLLSLLKDDAIMALPVFLRHLKRFYLEKRRLIKATVISSIPVDGGYLERIGSILRDITKREVDLEVMIDRSILGGVVIRFDNTIYDLSLKGQLNILKNEIIKG